MPIGASKVGALGGLVPGGSVTFNTSGNWDVPPGVKLVSITGVGGTGNPGNAGNSGNPGNPGTGGGGGLGGGGRDAGANCGTRGPGGDAYYTFTPGPLGPGNVFRTNNPPFNQQGNNNFPNYLTRGAFNICDFNRQYNNAQSGRSGNAGTAGAAGNPGNTGQQSSGLGNTFPGGAGGNAGVAGNAGTGGTGGTGGSQGQTSSSRNATSSGGAGGNGGGSGGNGGTTCQFSPGPPQSFISGGQGGAGAGSVNNGTPGSNSALICPNNQGPLLRRPLSGTGNVNAPVLPNTNPRATGPIPTATMGGLGGRSGPIGNSTVGGRSINLLSQEGPASCVPSQPFLDRPTSNQFTPQTPNPAFNDVFRSGGGGGSGVTYARTAGQPGAPGAAGGGGGGGGRGNAGNAGGTSPTPTGSAGTPATFNCVPVTPGSTTPIVVGSPGGQVVISWNPQ